MEGGPECKAKPIYPTLSIAHLPPYSCCSLWGQGRTAGYVMHSLHVFYPVLPSPSWSPRDLPPLRFLGWRSWTERRVTTRSRDWGSCLFCILFPSRQSLEFPSGTVKSIILLICAEHPRPRLLRQLLARARCGTDESWVLSSISSIHRRAQGGWVPRICRTHLVFTTTILSL